MLQKLNSKRSGFTLVEIMIVVAIIALLAAIAVPNFLRARKRSQATSTLQTLRMIDAAKDQYAIDNGKSGTLAPDPADILPYIKKDSKLYTQLMAGLPYDEINNRIEINSLEIPPTLDYLTYDALADVLGDTTAQNAFWGAYKRY